MRTALIHASFCASILALGLTFGCKDKPEDDTGTTTNVDADDDGYSAQVDCDDNDPAIHPGADELCDGADNDCDGVTDEDDAVDATTWYPDGDDDGFGSEGPFTQACAGPEGYVDNSDDCADGDPDINPGADEICDGVDNDCSGMADDDPIDGDWYAVDADSDGMGALGSSALGCSGVSNEWDCDDTDPSEPQVVDIGAGATTPDGSLDAPWADIQDGIDSATSCVIVMSGTYTETIDFGGADLQVRGVEGPASTVIDGSGSGLPVVSFQNAETSAALLQGFTLIGGEGDLEETSESKSCGSSETCTDYYSTYCGGGLFVLGADPTLIDLVVMNNVLPPASSTSIGNDDYFVYSYGGGACFVDSAAAMSAVDFRRNFSDQGGALYVDETSIIDLNRSWLMANTSSAGGAVQVDGGSLTLANVASVWNVATAEGGGVLVIDGNLTELNVTHGGDDAPSGGGLAITGASSANLNSSIIYGAATGEGVVVDAGAGVAATYNNAFGNAGGNYSGISDPTGSDGNISSDPLFTDITDDGDPENDLWTLGTGSPSIDAGDPDSALNDQDGSRNNQGAFGGPGGVWD